MLIITYACAWIIMSSTNEMKQAENNMALMFIKVIN